MTLNNKYIIIGTFAIAIIFYMQLYWMLPILGAFSLLLNALPRIRNNRFTRWLYYSLSVIIMLSIAIVARLFFFELYNIPSPSMNNTLIPGDMVLVCKIDYGPKPPESPF